MELADLSQMTDQERVLDERLDSLVTTPSGVPPPDVLYHYTGLTGAEGIIRKQNFWLTSHACTNDTAEMRSVDDIIVDVLADLEHLPDPYHQIALKAATRTWQTHHVAATFDLALGCFSAARDKPSQWELYGDAGAGVCLGVRLPPARPLPEIAGGALFAARVSYGENEARERLRRECNAVLEVASPFPATANRAALVGLALVRLCALLSMSAKHAAWSAEEEWRVVALGAKDPGLDWLYRGAHNQIPYLSCALVSEGLLPVEEIMLGPRADVNASTLRLAAALADAGYGGTAAPMPLVVQSTAL